MGRECNPNILHRLFNAQTHIHVSLHSLSHSLGLNLFTWDVTERRCCWGWTPQHRNGIHCAHWWWERMWGSWHESKGWQLLSLLLPLAALIGEKANLYDWSEGSCVSPFFPSCAAKNRSHSQIYLIESVLYLQQASSLSLSLSLSLSP